MTYADGTRPRPAEDTLRYLRALAGTNRENAWPVQVRSLQTTLDCLLGNLTCDWARFLDLVYGTRQGRPITKGMVVALRTWAGVKRVRVETPGDQVTLRYHAYRPNKFSVAEAKAIIAAAESS